MLLSVTRPLILLIALSVSAFLFAAEKSPEPAGILGPSDIALRDQATLHLPDGFVFLPRPQADDVMKQWGNQIDERFLGLIFPEHQDAGWVVVAEWEPSGYIRDDDAKNWNVDELLDNIREGTEAANEARVKQGFKALEVVGWVQKPQYDVLSHQLVWSMAARHPGESDAQQSINYNTYALGREGYITLNMIAGRNEIDGYKSQAATLLSQLTFSEGKRYGDFNEGTDHVAEYGLAALVGGVAAKKLGLFAVLAAFVAKFAKVIIFAVGGFAFAIKRFFKRSN